MRSLSAAILTIVIASAATLAGGSSGCARSESAQGALSVPPANVVKLIPGRPSDITPDHLHFTWSVLGERNWTNAAASNLQISLSDAYPLNDVKRMHGTNTWNCDLIAERRAADPTVVHWSLILHGSNGVTARSEGDSPLHGATLDEAVVPVVSGDTSKTLPAKITLARINNAEVAIDLSK